LVVFALHEWDERLLVWQQHHNPSCRALGKREFQKIGRLSTKAEFGDYYEITTSGVQALCLSCGKKPCCSYYTVTVMPLKGLRVAARTSAFSFKGKSDDLRTIGEKLKVTTVLEGSVRRAGDRVRITVRVSDVANGFQLWSEQYDREPKDIFDVQDEIAKAIAERLRVTLAGGKDERLVEQATTNVEAYQFYLKGHALLVGRDKCRRHVLTLVAVYQSFRRRSSRWLNLLPPLRGSHFLRASFVAPE
jgi:hypothetical protein